MSESIRRLGDPMDLPAKVVDEAKDEPLAKTDESTIRRAGDSGLGVPEFDAEESRTVSEEETEAYRRNMEEQLNRQAAAMLSDLEQKDGWVLPVALRNFLVIALVVLSAVLGLFLITEFVQFFANIRALPMWSRWLATACLFLFGGVLVAVLCGLIWGIIRLRRSPRIPLKSIMVLSERQRMQRFAAGKQVEACTLLEEYLRCYPFTGTARKRLLALGMSEAEWNSLNLGKDRLLDSSRPLTHAEWLNDFQRCFQRILDELASRRIKQYSTRIGIGTAASPIPMVDRMIVLYGCTAMVKDLFLIYHLRPAFGQTIIILARSVVHTYLSGMIEESTETIADVASDSLNDFLEEGAGVLTGAVGRAIGAKSAEAVLNGLLINRLGRRAMAQLQPVCV